MVQSVDEMKFPPLLNGEGAKERMIHELGLRPEFRSAGRQQTIHFAERGLDFSRNFVRSSAAWTRPIRRFPSCRHISKSDNDKRLSTLLPGGFCRERLARLKQPATTFDRASVGKIEMFEDFGDAPLAHGMPDRLFRGQSLNCRCNLPL